MSVKNGEYDSARMDDEAAFSKTIVIVVNGIDYFISHRQPIADELLQKGHQVHVVAPDRDESGRISAGVVCHQVPMSRKGTNPFADLWVIGRLYRLFRQVKPDLVHLVTIKPYLYGGVAARLARIPAVISAVAGLGILFSQQSFKSRLLRCLLYPLFQFALHHANQKVIFQNRDDKAQLMGWVGLAEARSLVIRGSGVSLDDYPCIAEPEGVPVISFASRLLRDKGVLEYVEASRLLKKRNVDVRFWLIGEPDPGNANTVTQAEIDAWVEEGLVEYLGYRNDIASLFGQSNMVTLPSYYGEGLPKVLIEAEACGRAVLTTDHPGCRDAITPDVTGLLVPVREAGALADAIQQLVEDPSLRRQMGNAGRKLVEQELTIEHVVDQHMHVYRELLGQ